MTAPTVAETFFDADAVRASATLLRLGLVHTLRLVGMAFLVALGLGAVALWARSRTASWLRRAGIAYVDLVRATPPIVLLVVVYYALPAVGLPSLDAFQTGWLSLGLVQGAYVSEVYRAGWLAVEPGQRLAARAIGLTEAQVDKVTALKQKHPGLDDAQALLLARAAHPDVFPSQAQRFNPALHGALPVSGISEARGDGTPIDHTKAMNEAAKQNKLLDAQQHATAHGLRPLGSIERRVGMPHMEMAIWAGRETEYGLAHGPES